MASYGRFQVIQELHRTANGSVSVAKVAGDVVGARFAVKAFDITQMGLLEADAAAQAFLDRAALQKQLTQHGAQHWAPVHELRSTEDGAYYVTDVYPVSAQTLLDARAGMTAKALHNLISSAVAGLLELKVHKGRAHGNLKPTNILVSGRDPGSEDVESFEDARVFLTDPASEADGADSVASDLYALGELIHQFVLHRPSRVRGHSAWPVAESPEWENLGPTGGQWLELCNWLINPNPAERAADVESVAIALRNLAPGKKGRRRGRAASAGAAEVRERPPRRVRKFPRWVGKLAAAAVVLLVLGGAAVFVLSRMNESVRSELADVRAAWFGAFEQSMRDPLRRGAYRADPDLKAIVDEFDRAEAEGVRFEPGGGTPADFRAYERNRAAVAAVRRIEQALSPQRWRKLAELSAMREQYEARGWSQPASYVGKLVAGVRPALGADVAGGVDRVLRAHPVVSANAETTDENWRKFEANLEAMDKANDPVLKGFANTLRAKTAAAVQLGETGFEGLAELEKNALPLSSQFAKLARNGWPAGYGRDRFKQEVEDTLNLASPGYPEMQRWLEAVDQYALVSLPPRTDLIVSARGQVQALSDDASRYPLSDAERSGFEAQKAQVEAKLKALEEGKFVRKDVEQSAGQVAVLSVELTNDLDQLKKWVKITDPLQWVAAVKGGSLNTASEVLRSRWKGWVDVLTARGNELSADPKKLPPVKEATDAMREALVALDKKFPPVPPGLKEHKKEWTEAAWDRREKYLAGLSKWAEVKHAAAAGTLTAEGVPIPPDPATVDVYAAEYAAWAQKLQDLTAYFPLTKELLTLRDEPDAFWKAKDAAFWDDAVVKSLVAEDVKRIARIQEVATAPRQRLVELAAVSDVAEVALAAWKRLGEPGPGQVSPPWPTRDKELELERDLRARMAGFLKPVQDAAARAELEQELAAQGPERWRRFTNAADPRLMQSAANLRAAFGITDPEIEKLQTGARFNLRRWDARVAAASNQPDAVLKGLVDRLRTAAEALPDRKDRPDIEDLLFKLARIDKPEPMSGRPFNAAAGQYQLNISPDSQYAIQFLRVESSGMRPFYLSTTEVSVGAYIDMVGTAKTWDPAHALLGNFPADGERAPAVRRGPRVWLAPPSVHQPIALPDPPTWRWDNGQQFVFAKGLRAEFNRNDLDPRYGAHPQLEHPMQQAPAQAALYAAGLVNCRLPTSAEWRAAYDVFKKEQAARGGAGRANLRDRTYERQRAEPTRQWPDAEVSGVFFPRDGRKKNGQFVNVDDGVLLFRTVTSGGGETFVNLVGNVAEFTCDAADLFDALPADQKRSPTALARFATDMASKKKLSVIGASALSEPQLKEDEPLPVTSPAEAYADVGFRLAFTAPAQSMAERLRWALDEQPHVVTAKAGP